MPQPQTQHPQTWRRPLTTASRSRRRPRLQYLVAGEKWEGLDPLVRSRLLLAPLFMRKRDLAELQPALAKLAAAGTADKCAAACLPAGRPCYLLAVAVPTACLPACLPTHCLALPHSLVCCPLPTLCRAAGTSGCARWLSRWAALTAACTTTRCWRGPSWWGARWRACRRCWRERTRASTARWRWGAALLAGFLGLVWDCKGCRQFFFFHPHHPSLG